MTLSLVTREEAINRLAQRADSAEALSELLRSEIHARKHAPRSTTLLRVARLLAPAMLVAESELDEICDALVREGDIVLAPGGMLYSTPTRVVALGDSARVFSSAPMPVLAVALGRDVLASGATRSVASLAGLAEAVAEIGGALVTPEAWAGLDRTPIADDAFLAKLVQRLEWESLAAASLEKDGPLEWRTWQMTNDGWRWRRSTDGQLWSARTRFGGHVRVWTSGASPDKCPFVVLSYEDADRARFATARTSSAPFVGTSVANGDKVQLGLPFSLPRSEYRYVSLLARQTVLDSGERVWTTSSLSADTLYKVLSERLGIHWQGDRAGGIDEQPDETARAIDAGVAQTTETAHSASEVADQWKWTPPDPLTERVQASGITLLLSELKVETYGDLLGLDLLAARMQPKVGPARYAMLVELVAEAERRSGKRREGSVSQQPPEPELAPGPYDDWMAGDALGRLQQRVKSVIETHDIKSIGQLKALISASNVEHKQRLGPSTRAELLTLLKRLETEGHEMLVFGGSVPQDLTAFAEQYIAQMGDNVREIAELWWVQGWTLQRIADERGVSRERVRQVRNAEIDRTAPGWRDRARSLLAPIVNAIEAQGGIASTHVIDVAGRSPAQWVIELAAELGEVALKWNIRPGIATVLSEEAFEELEKELRDTFEDHPTTMMTVEDFRILLLDHGLRIPEKEIAEVAGAMLSVTIDGDNAFLRRRAVAAAYVGILRDAGAPISAKEVTRRLNEIDPEFRATPQNAVINFRRSSEVISADHGLWVHHDHLPFPRAVLDDVAARCLPIVQAAEGQAVSIRPVLDGLIADGIAPATMTTQMLREALRQTGRVRAWRIGAEVAWLGGDVSRISILEWVKVVVAELDPPFTYDEIIEEVVQRSGQLASSVRTQVASQFDDMVPVASTRYISRAATWPNAQDFDGSKQSVRAALNGSSLWSAQSDELHVPGIEHLISKFGRGIVYGLASVDSEFHTRAAGLLIWRRTSGESVWDVIGESFFGHGLVFKGSSLRDYLASSCGVRSYQLANRLIAEGVEAGMLVRLGLGWYLPSHLSSDQQMEALAEQPEILRMTLSSQDFVRESPARELLNDLRSLHGQFRIPAA